MHNFVYLILAPGTYIHKEMTDTGHNSAISPSFDFTFSSRFSQQQEEWYILHSLVQVVYDCDTFTHTSTCNFESRATTTTDFFVSRCSGYAQKQEAPRSSSSFPFRIRLLSWLSLVIFLSPKSRGRWRRQKWRTPNPRKKGRLGKCQRKKGNKPRRQAPVFVLYT